jgi:uncharacterized protein
MRPLLQGFTMYIDSSDFGYDCEEVTLPIPTPVTQEYRGGGMDLSVAQPLAALEAMEATVKMAGHNPDILRRMAKGPGQTTRITFRGAVLNEPAGMVEAHVCVIEGAPNAGSRDAWHRGEKAGVHRQGHRLLPLRRPGPGRARGLGLAAAPRGRRDRPAQRRQPGAGLLTRQIRTSVIRPLQTTSSVA